METISKAMGESLAGRGELYAALAYDSSDRFGGLAIKQVRFNPAASTTAIIIGVSGTAITLAVAAQRAISIHTTSALTTGAIKSVEIAQVHTVDSTSHNIEVMKVQLTSDVKTGTWVNAIFGRVNYTEDGWAYGSASAICGEISLAPGGSHSGQGTYSCFQGEMDVPASAVGIGAECSFIRLSAWGTQVGLFDDNGFLFSITGVTSGSAHLWYDNQGSAPGNVEEWLRIKTPAGTRYLAVYNAVV